MSKSTIGNRLSDFDDAKEERIPDMPFMPNYVKFNSA